MNIFRSKKLTKILPLLTARYSILCTRRLQPPRDDSAVRVQWFSSVMHTKWIKDKANKKATKIRMRNWIFFYF